LWLAFVAHFELVLREIRDEAAVPVRDRDEYANQIAAATECRLLLCARSDDRENATRQDRARK
jgi:hypothetical protein